MHLPLKKNHFCKGKGWLDPVGVHNYRNRWIFSNIAESKSKPAPCTWQIPPHLRRSILLPLLPEVICSIAIHPACQRAQVTVNGQILLTSKESRATEVGEESGNGITELCVYKGFDRHTMMPSGDNDVKYGEIAANERGWGWLLWCWWRQHEPFGKTQFGRVFELSVRDGRICDLSPVPWSVVNVPTRVLTILTILR